MFRSRNDGGVQASCEAEFLWDSGTCGRMEVVSVVGSGAVLLFSKLNEICFGYFDPENMF